MNNRQSGAQVFENSTVLINTPNIESELKNNCRHYWLIDKANGPLSHAICKFCKEERNFNNSPFEYITDGMKTYPDNRSHRQPLGV